MNTDEAIAHAAANGFRVWSMQQVSQGGRWTIRLWNYYGRKAGERGYNDSFTDYGLGETPAVAILDAMQRCIDPETGRLADPQPPREPSQGAVRGHPGERGWLNAPDAPEPAARAPAKPPAPSSTDLLLAIARLHAAVDQSLDARKGTST